MADFRMPQLGADMMAATLVEWLKKPGDRVKRGDIMAVVETDKGAIEVEVFEDGVVEKLVVEPGAKVPVGTILAVLDGEEREPVAEPGAPAQSPPVPEQRQASVPPKPVTRLATTRISPAAARLAAEIGVDIKGVAGTGPGGAIRMADVEAASKGRPPSATEPTAAEAAESPAAAMRRAIAAAMSRSKREIPHYYVSTTIDMGRALRWLADANEQRQVTERLLYGVMLLKAVARALDDFPELNGFWRGDGFQPGDGIHVGWAISLRGGGLVAPAIHDAGRIALDPLMAALRDLVKRARSFRLRSSELGDPTITVTSLGEQGVESVYGVIYPPQTALVGFGRIAERPWVDGGAVVARPVIQASLAADHRASDGHRGGLFLSAVDRLLQEPEKL